MYQVIQRQKQEGEIIPLDSLEEHNFTSSIIVAEKGDVQDILIGLPVRTSGFGCPRTENVRYCWQSLYLRPRARTAYPSIKHAIESRLEKGMQVYVFRNRGEFRAFLKYNGERA